MEVKRKFNTARLFMIPFLKTLDVSFFIRLAFFSGAVYYCAKQGAIFSSEKVVCKQPDA